MNTKLHTVTDANGRPISLVITAGQVSDYTGGAALMDRLPRAQLLLGNRGYYADWPRESIVGKGITPCTPGRNFLTDPVRYDKRRYKIRDCLETMLEGAKEPSWRGLHYDRFHTVLMSATALAAMVLF